MQDSDRRRYYLRKVVRCFDGEDQWVYVVIAEEDHPCREFSINLEGDLMDDYIYIEDYTHFQEWFESTNIPTPEYFYQVDTEAGEEARPDFYWFKEVVRLYDEMVAKEERLIRERFKTFA